jgi:hypothetical protein
MALVSHKNKLQEMVQKVGPHLSLPIYETKPSNDGGFVSTVKLPDGKTFTGTTMRRKVDAELNCAKIACEYYEKNTFVVSQQTTEQISSTPAIQLAPTAQKNTQRKKESFKSVVFVDLENWCKVCENLYKNGKIYVIGVCSKRFSNTDVVKFVDEYKVINSTRKESADMYLCSLLVKSLMTDNFEYYFSFSQDNSIISLTDLPIVEFTDAKNKKNEVFSDILDLLAKLSKI